MSLDVVELLGRIESVGRAEDGSYWRFSLTDVDAVLRQWFTDVAHSLGLTVESDPNANLVAWWDGAEGDESPGASRAGAVLTGSHVDSVPGGGALDGPLGVASSLAAVSRLIEAGVRPSRPVGVVLWTDEEGSRFDMPCLGSRLACGDLDPDKARNLPCRDGGTLAEAWTAAGLDPTALGPTTWALDAACLVELHVEQGRALADGPHPVAVATAVRPHTRMRVDVVGRPDHAGTTLMPHRQDPVVATAAMVLAARRAALESPDPMATATVGRTHIAPGGTNVIAGQDTSWLDCRAETEDGVREVLERIEEESVRAGRAEGCQVTWTRESWTPRVEFDADLSELMVRVLGDVPRLSTGAGHDAAVMAAHVPAAMLFVRNPTGASHTPAETASDADCRAGVDALTAVLEELVR